MMEAREVPVCLLVLLFCAASCWLMASAVQVTARGKRGAGSGVVPKEIFSSRKFFPSAHMLEFPVTTHKRRTEAGTEADAFAAHTHTTGAAGGQHHTHTHLTSRKHTQNTHHTRSNPFHHTSVRLLLSRPAAPAPSCSVAVAIPRPPTSDSHVCVKRSGRRSIR